jgi:protein-S-isoprenylcysteine O-methyltransferase Ste14
VLGIGAFALLLFLPAGTLNYWQGWIFIFVFMVATLVPSIYLAIHDPEALKRRMKAGPTKETRPVQRIVIAVCFLLLPGMMVLAGLDHRFGWSTVPVTVVVVGDVLVAAGLLLAQWVVIQNSYAAATITVEQEQPLVSTGLYGVVRHPLYVGALIMMVGAPLALGSLWALTIPISGLAARSVSRIAPNDNNAAASSAAPTRYTTRKSLRSNAMPTVAGIATRQPVSTPAPAKVIRPCTRNTTRSSVGDLDSLIVGSFSREQVWVTSTESSSS